jgi:hypothetical protein
VIGDKTADVKIKADNLFSKPKTIKIEGLKRIIDLKKCPLWKLRAVTRLPSKKLGLLLKRTQKYSIMDEQDFMAAIQIGTKEIERMKENIIFKFSGKMITPSDIISKDQIEILKKINIFTTQQIWNLAKTEKEIRGLSEKTGIKYETFMKFRDEIEKTRIINQETKNMDRIKKIR